VITEERTRGLVEDGRVLEEMILTKVMRCDEVRRGELRGEEREVSGLQEMRRGADSVEFACATSRFLTASTAHG
jgi:hypothetical protein